MIQKKTSKELEALLEEERAELAQKEAAFVTARSRFAEALSRQSELADDDRQNPDALQDAVDGARRGMHSAERACDDQRALIANTTHKIELAKAREADKKVPVMRSRAAELKKAIAHHVVNERMEPIRDKQARAVALLTDAMGQRVALREELLGLHREFMQCQSYLDEPTECDNRIDTTMLLNDLDAAYDEAANGCPDQIQRKLVLDLKPSGKGFF